MLICLQILCISEMNENIIIIIEVVTKTCHMRLQSESLTSWEIVNSKYGVNLELPERWQHLFPTYFWQLITKIDISKCYITPKNDKNHSFWGILTFNFPGDPKGCEKEENLFGNLIATRVRNIFSLHFSSSYIFNSGSPPQVVIIELRKCFLSLLVVNLQ